MLALNTLFAAFASAETDGSASPDANTDSNSTYAADLIANKNGLSEGEATFFGTNKDERQKEATNPASTNISDVNHKAKDIMSSSEGEKVEITLTASPKESTTGPVTITVSINNAKKIKAIKWLPGEKSVKDFKSAGNQIDPSNPTFQVEENGTYTVYVQSKTTNPCGLCQQTKNVKSITIDNIKKEEPVPTPEPEPTPTPEPTPAPTPSPTPAPVQTPAQAAVSDLTVTPIAVKAASVHTLPQTATATYNYIAAGLLLIAGGLSVIALQRKRQRRTN
jgi:LPXTG-motif cell wall-anchored protein